ncbi:ankyrin repeat domain-containing protein 40-like [Linepithema humile]|uniref:ankyrin repeat domain-containing protein 40-like n=1 Tax=Linepithema humile TaxID=83485 RepID=UPI00062374B5|nr:PREDICTED: ankyrin repeat domain-containing protein 40-like [Linepithema humile]
MVSIDSYDMRKVLEERMREAARNGNTDVLQDLVDMGIDVNARQPDNGWTALHWACKKGYLDVAALLLKNGADKNLRSETGETPVSLCINQQILHLLDTSITSSSDELVLKIRIANAADPDFVEVELSRTDLTYRALLYLCCMELDLKPQQIQKLRKLPNTRLRKDKDIQRLQNFQEIEIITDTTNMYKSMQNINGTANSLPPLPANGYQSISKKDQTILY